MTARRDPDALGRRVRPIRWGGREAAGAGTASLRAPAIASLPWFDQAAFIGQFAPELARLAGTRISLRPAPAPEQPVDLVRVLDARNKAVAVSLDLERPAIGQLLERMFGGSVQDGPPGRDQLALLSPAAASWRGLSSCLSRAFHAGLGAALGQAPPAPAPVARIAGVAIDGPGSRLWFLIAIDGAVARLALACRDLAAEAAVATPEQAERVPVDTPSAWAERAARMVNLVDLAVGIRLSEQQLPLAAVLALGPGSILPIDRPRELVLIVDGKPLRRFDMAALAPPGVPGVEVTP
jgi:hypothetical protein